MNTAQQISGYVTIKQVKVAGGKWNGKIGLYIFKDGSAGCFENGQGSKFFENYKSVNGQMIK